MFEVFGTYSATFGKGDGSDSLDWEHELSDEEYEVFKNNLKNEEYSDFSHLPESVQEEIEKELYEIEKENMMDLYDSDDDFYITVNLSENFRVCTNCGEVFVYDDDFEDDGICEECRDKLNLDEAEEYWFPVTACLGRGDGGEISVSVPVTDDEYEALKDCYREDEEIEQNESLAGLIRRIERAAFIKCENINDSYGDTEEDYSSASFMIGFPDEVVEEVDAE